MQLYYLRHKSQPPFSSCSKSFEVFDNSSEKYNSTVFLLQRPFFWIRAPAILPYFCDEIWTYCIARQKNPVPTSNRQKGICKVRQKMFTQVYGTIRVATSLQSLSVLFGPNALTRTQIVCPRSKTILLLREEVTMSMGCFAHSVGGVMPYAQIKP